MPPQNKALELIYGSNVSDVNVELKAVHIKPHFYGYNSSSNAKLSSGETPIKHVGNLAKQLIRTMTEYSKPHHYRCSNKSRNRYGCGDFPN
jgi:hypothetical protein